MTFQSDAVTLQWQQNNLILKRGESSLIINPENVSGLRTQENEEAFQTFFRTTALQNRQARRVFEAWEKKDNTLLKKIYQEMMS